MRRSGVGSVTCRCAPLEWREVRDKGLAATQAVEVAEERQLTRGVAVGEPRQEEPAEQAGQDWHW